MGCEGAGPAIRSMSVEVLRTVKVLPERTPAKNEVLRLSNLDRKCPTLMYMVFFYGSATCFETIFKRMKVGLERCLTEWYPAAGRLHFNKQGKVDLLCNNAGAVMVAASTSLTLRDLGDISQYSPFFDKLVYKPACGASFTDMPLVVIQVTRFACDGISIGFGGSHSLFDGVGAMNFLNSWAEFTRPTGTAATTRRLPQHDRSSLLVDSMAISENGSGKVAALEELGEMIERAAKTQEKKLWECRFGDISWVATGGYVLKTFTLSRHFVESLKNLSRSSGGPLDCTVFEALAAHLWMARVKALRIPEDSKVCLQFTVEVRNRVRPVLPREFSGNAFVMACAACSVRRLFRGGLGEAAARIRGGKDEVTDAYVRRYMFALEAPQKALPSLQELTIVSDWRHMPFHLLDVGAGPAVAAVPLASPVPQSAYLMRNVRDDASVDVRLGLLAEHVEAFRRNLMGIHEAWEE